MYNFKQFLVENSSNLSPANIADKYTKKYGGSFFNEFIKIFDTSKDFEYRLYKYTGYDDSEEYDKPEDSWDPESEVYMLKSELESKYPGDKIWVDFHNDLVNSFW